MSEEIGYKGLVGFSRVTGGGKRLYMSNLNNANWITLKVYEAKDEEKYGEVKAFTKTRHPIVDIDLSSAQFAELLTTMNIGSGVPCTIKAVQGKRIDQSPLDKDDKPLDIGKKFFEKNAREFTENLVRKTDSYLKDLDTMKISKKDKAKMECILSGIKTEITSNMPFYVSIFEETTEKVISESKAEIEAFVTGGIVKAGLDALGLNGQSLIEETEDIILSEDC